jgi:H+-transporting ATPase
MCVPETFLVLEEVKSYHWSPSLRYEQFFMQTSDATRAAAPTIVETPAMLGTDDKTGLTQAEVEERLKKYGPNALVEKEKSTWSALLAYFWGPIPWMIEAAALMAFVVGGLG